MNEMKIEITGGRFGFNFWCVECDEGLDEIGDGMLQHPATTVEKTDNMFFVGKEIPCTCQHAGKKVKKPKVVVDAEEVIKAGWGSMPKTQ